MPNFARARACWPVGCAPEEVAAFAAAQLPREVVVYCVYGHNVSADAVATLRATGWDAHALAGGIEGEKTAQTPKKTLPSGAHSPPRPSSSDLTGG